MYRSKNLLFAVVSLVAALININSTSIFGNSLDCNNYPPPKELVEGFSMQPDDSKVYLKVDEVDVPTISNAGLTKYASVFGIRLLANGEVDNAKLLHAANILAELLDPNGRGRPGNPELVETLRYLNAMVTIMKNHEQINGVFDLFPTDYECHVFLIPEVESSIVPGGTKEKDCPDGIDTMDDEELANVDKTVGYIAYFLINSGYPTNFPTNSEQGKALEEAFLKSLRNGWFHGFDSDCNADCQRMSFQAWVFTSALGYDTCTCREAGQWTLCSQQEMMEADPQLYSTLTQGLRKPTGAYASTAIVQ